MRGLLVVLLLFAINGTAWSQWTDEAQKCYEASLPSKTIDFDLVVQYCTRAIRSGRLSAPNLAMAFHSRGYAYVNKGQYDRAIEDYDTAIRLNPNDANAFYSRGYAYVNKGQYDRAIEDYDTVIRLNPNDTIAFHSRGYANFNKGQHDRAIEDYDTAIRLNPNDANAFHSRGRAYVNKGQYDRAIDDYDTAIRLNPNYANALQSRGNARFDLGRFTEAQADLARAVELNPDDTFGIIWLYLARARAGQDGKSELERNARRLKMESWPGPVVKLYMGTASPESVLSAAKVNDAKKDKEQHCEAYFYLGQHALLRGDRAEAMRLFKATIDTGVTNFMEYTGARTEVKRMEVR